MVAVLVFPGTNCHEDIEYIYSRHLGIDTYFVRRGEVALPRETRLAIVAGGFSYGDYLRSGALAATSPSIGALRRYIDGGGCVLGICNGFQILCEARLLPGALLRNQSLRFISKNVQLEVLNTNNHLLRNYKKGGRIRIPVAHAEGNYQVDSKTLESMYENGQILLTYTMDLNGSVDSIAGICNKEKTIYAMMPHPERAINFKSINDKTPDNSSENIDGIEMLRSLYYLG